MQIDTGANSSEFSSEIPDRRRLEYLGAQLQEQGRLDEAEAAFGELSAKHPEHVGGWRGLALVARKRGDRGAALAHFLKARECELANVWNLFDIAEELRELGRLDEAEAAYREIVAGKPDAASAWRGLGLIARRRGDRALAAESMSNAVKANPANLWVKCELAEDLRELGRLDEATDVCREILAADAGMAAAWRGLALIARKQGDRATCSEHFRKALDLDPKSPWLRCEAADALRDLGRLDEADQFYREALDARETLAGAWRGRGAIASRRGRHEEAAAHFRRAVALAPDDASHQSDLIGALRQSGEAEEAGRLAEALLARHPHAPTAIAAYVDARRGQIDREEIIRLHESAVAHAPGDVWARINLAEEYVRADRLDEAQPLYERTLAEQPDNVSALVGKARIARKLGDHAASRLLLDRAVAAPGATAWTRNERADSMAEAGEVAEAEAYIRAQVALHPESDAHYVQLGHILRSKGDKSGAHAAYAKASELNPESESAILQTAVEAFQLGWIAQAIEAAAPLVSRSRPTPQALETLAGFAEAMDDFETGALLRSRALGIDPFRPWAWLGLAGALAKLGRDEELNAALGQYEDRFGQTADLASFRARHLKDRADVAGADAVLTEASEKFPAHFGLWADRVAITIARGFFDAADESLARAKPLSAREKLRVWQLRGQSAMAQWQADRAYACFAEALKINPAESWLNDQAARAALLLANADVAMDHLALSASTSASHRLYNRGACKPMLSIAGQLADEYRIDRFALDGLRAALAGPDRGAALGRLVLEFPDYTPAAIAYLTELRRSGRAPALAQIEATGDSPIPRRLQQYWDEDIPPDVQRLCDGWASSERDFDYRRFSAADAAEFIREKGDMEAFAAFRRARGPAAQADLFRLFVLVHRGGFFVDADDRRLGPLARLAPGGRDLTLCLEDWGTAGNNFIGAIPHHPVIARALEQAVASINSSDNEMIWLATGPGLMTRCLAGYLAEDPENRLTRAMILDLHEIQGAVGAHSATSYKYSQRHWTRSAFHRRQDKSLSVLRAMAEQAAGVPT